MAKERILTRSETFKVMKIKMTGTDAERQTLTDYQREKADVSMLAYMLADGHSVRVYNDYDLGGASVEYEG